jgi:N-acetylglucosamine-6-phosphate deacetylase
MSIPAIHYMTGQAISIGIEHGIITSIEPLRQYSGDNNVTIDESQLSTAAPGLVDLQINGYGGLDFNQIPIADGVVSDVIRKLWQEGVTSSYPTIITNSEDQILEAMKHIARICGSDPIADRGIAGIHLEGPFISPQDGARGAHNPAFVRPPDWEWFCRWQETSGGRIKILTLSPEWPESEAFISRCAKSGVIVSIGHTSATAEQIQRAAAAGARMSTHLGNGAHLMMPRHPNYIWEQLAQDQLWSCLIADGFHLPDQLLKVVMKVKGNQAMIVSDAVSLSGLPSGTYSTPIGGKVVLTSEGRLHLAENERILAGSAQMLLWGIEHLSNRGLASLAEAWDMASIRPAGFMQLPCASGLALGAPADFVLYRKEGNRIQLKQTYKSGELVYSIDTA